MTRLKLRDDAYYAPTGEGIRILTNSGEVTLNGSSIFRWIDQLAPYLDGRYTLAELTASMPADRREMTERIVNALRDRGVIVAADDVKDSGLTDAERRAYRRDIDFLSYFSSSPQRGFRAYRDSDIVLVGAGRLLVKTVEAALCSGSRRLRVVVTGECPTDMALLAECERQSRQHDAADPRTSCIAADSIGEQRLSDTVSGADIVIYVADRASVDRAGTLGRVCGRAGIPFVAAILAGEEAWLGPFRPVNGERCDWMSAWRRLLALNRTDLVGADAPYGELFVGAAPTVVANQLIREAVRLLSRTAVPVGQSQMTRIDLRSLRTQRHGFLPHPFSLAVASPDQFSQRATIGRLSAGDRVDPEEFARRVPACIQPRLGVLGEVTERDFTQLPLAVSQVEVSDPVLLLGPGVPLPIVVGADLSHADARRAAVLRGLAVYGSLMVDPRRLHVRGDVADPRTGDPEEDLNALRAGRWDGFVWGHGLADGQAHELPAATVFPALCGLQSGYLPPAGVAAGYDWAEAVRAGLVGQCRRLTLSEIAERPRPFTPIDWKELELDGHGDRYRSMMTIIGARLDVYDVTGAPRVPTLAFNLDGVTVAYTCGFSFGQALRDGLAEVLLSHQAHTDGEADYAPAAVPPLPLDRRLPAVDVCPTWTTNEATTADRLARLGWTAVAVPLDHDPGVTAAIMAYLVNIVLIHA